MTSILISGKVAYLISFSLIGIYNKKYRESEGDFERGDGRYFWYFLTSTKRSPWGKGHQPEEGAGSSRRDTQQDYLLVPGALKMAEF